MTPREAANDADACLKLQPKHAKARFAKGRALYFLGEYEQAFAQYDAGLAVEPRQPMSPPRRRGRPRQSRTR